MIRISKKRYGFPTSTVWIILCLLILTAGKQNQDNTPAPQATTVSINGKDYPVRTIGNQVWTVANYEGPGGIAYGTGNEKSEYGRYYTLDEAKAIVVPAGWRLPTRQDYTTLAESQGVVFSANRATAQEAIKKLTSTTNWRTIPGTNASGFNAYPAGYSYQNSAPIDGDISEFWTAEGTTFSIQEDAQGKAHNIVFYGNESVGYRFNVRFVKNT
ncbi:FISUMP domain-containing protein [Spirosoma sp.]|uniref:FISUMP domain-containing protein n=1 Tax=Spirosoma sp. TaxID=1899569 RepID=UPI003B3A7BF8